MKQWMRCLGYVACLSLWNRAGPARAEDPFVQAVRLEELERVVAASHPLMARDASLIDAAREGQKASGRLPAPELSYQQWAVPLARPHALNEANMLMLGVRQRVSLRGQRHAQQDLGRATQVSRERAREVTRQDLVRDVRVAFFEYLLAWDELSLHMEHAALARQTLDISLAAYASGRGAQADLLRGRMMLAELGTEIALLKAERDRAQAALNVLVGRDAAMALGKPERPARDTREERALGPTQPPEVTWAEARASEARLAAEAARASAQTPELTLGLDYIAMPMEDRYAGYGAMVAVSLPWLSGAREPAIEQGEAEARAAESEREAFARTAQREVAQGLAAERGALEALNVIDEQLVPSAEQRFDALQVALSSGRATPTEVLDALEDLLRARIERLRARTRVDLARVLVARALGAKELPALSPPPRGAP